MIDELDDLDEATVLSARHAPAVVEPDDEATMISQRRAVAPDDEATVLSSRRTGEITEEYPDVTDSAPRRIQPPPDGTIIAAPGIPDRLGRVVYVPDEDGIVDPEYPARAVPAIISALDVPVAPQVEPSVLAARQDAATASARTRRRKVRASATAVVIAAALIVATAAAGIMFLVVWY
jgi:hypothetical protein